MAWMRSRRVQEGPQLRCGSAVCLRPTSGGMRSSRLSLRRRPTAATAFGTCAVGCRPHARLAPTHFDPARKSLLLTRSHRLSSEKATRRWRVRTQRWVDAKVLGSSADAGPLLKLAADCSTWNRQDAHASRVERGPFSHHKWPDSAAIVAKTQASEDDGMGMGRL